uniref:GTP-binding protein Rhes n=1 Tax=Timema cristinae TaxID=61476 RepID=A0A7R9H6Z8_TIMCR|nr:unnamed protein product [Timema cristinae]
MEGHGQLSLSNSPAQSTHLVGVDPPPTPNKVTATFVLRRQQTMPGAGGRVRLPSLGTDASSGGGHSGVSQKEQHRVVVMGAARVGKSSIISQFLYDKFNPRYRETIEELHRGEYELQDGASLTLDILDTSGAFQFPAMRALSISTADAFILVYAVDDVETWEEVRRLRDQDVDTPKYLAPWIRISDYFLLQILEARGCRVPIVVVGNKEDLSEEGVGRAVPKEVAETTALFDWECGYVECSAKNNRRIVDVFKELLVQAKVRYNLSPAVRRRRQSLPNYVTGSGSAKSKHMLKRNSCTVA